MDLYANDVAGRADLYEAGWLIHNGYVVIDNTGGRYGGGAAKCYSAPTSANSAIALPVNIAASTLMIQAAFRPTGLSNMTDDDFIVFKNNCGADIVASIKTQTDGSLKVYNANGVNVATSAAGVLLEGVYKYIQVKVVSHSVTGSVRILLDDVEIINVTGIDTSISATDIDLFYLFAGGIPSITYWDDIIVLDDSGPAPHNDLMGDLRISVLVPIADNVVSDWNKSSGVDGYALIDDAVPGDHDGDTTYIYDDTVGGKSLFTFAPFTGSAVFIASVGIAAAVRKSDAGTKSMRVYLNSGGTVSNGDTLNVSTDYRTFRHIWSQNPDTGAEWSKVGVNALLGGVEVIT